MKPKVQKIWIRLNHGLQKGLLLDVQGKWARVKYGKGFGNNLDGKIELIPVEKIKLRKK